MTTGEDDGAGGTADDRSWGSRPPPRIFGLGVTVWVLGSSGLVGTTF